MSFPVTLWVLLRWLAAAPSIIPCLVVEKLQFSIGQRKKVCPKEGLPVELAVDRSDRSDFIGAKLVGRKPFVWFSDAGARAGLGEGLDLCVSTRGGRMFRG